MALLCAGFLQRIEQRPLDTHGVMEVAAGFLHDGVNPLEPEAWDLAQPERAFPQQLHTVRAEMLINFGSSVE